ncbi:hypothetical protein ALC60_06815 [Trachymyrmex zeteki]|uniref:Uncharacterized protein n=1 Tax=Mycetomoellerius zeteki TaxID=64791 RepID=A0A151X1I1_9HYME|nr:hypothetical protein ALC60_06815 [Trachymyrmex zeteki]
MKRGRGRMWDAGGSRRGGSILRSLVDPGLLANRDRTGRIRVSSRVESDEVVGADALRANVERYKCARASLRL